MFSEISEKTHLPQSYGIDSPVCKRLHNILRTFYALHTLGVAKSGLGASEGPRGVFRGGRGENPGRKDEYYAAVQHFA